MNEKFNSIQALRGLAALVVAIFHSHLAVYSFRDGLIKIPVVSSHGYYAVQFFFVISGFIIAHVISTRERDFFIFVWRRIWRIYPVLILCSVVFLFLHYKLGWYKPDMAGLDANGIVASFFSFPQQHYPVVPPAWSIEHEILFYMLAAVIGMRLGLRNFALLLVFLWVVGLHWKGWDHHLFHHAQLFFAAGIFVYLARSVTGLIGLPICVLSGMFVYAYIYQILPANPPALLFFMAIFFATIIHLGLRAEAKGLRIPMPLARLGDVTYSLYLCHWMVFTANGYIMIKVFGHGAEYVEMWRWIAVSLAIITAFAMFYGLERPLIRKARKYEPIVASRLRLQLT